MSAINGPRKGTGMKVLAFMLALALCAPGLAAKDRRGAEVVLTMRSGAVIQGELLAVRGTDLTLLRGSTSAEDTEHLADIGSIKVLGKSKWLNGMVIGAITGAVVGAVVTPTHPDPNADDVSLNKGEAAVVGAICYGALGAAIGSAIKNKTIKVEKTDPAYLAEIASKLKSLARDPG